jgi:hypothetical protein
MTPQEKIAKLEGQLLAVLQAYSILEEYTCMLVDDTEENEVITKANSIVQIAMNDELNN